LRNPVEVRPVLEGAEGARRPGIAYEVVAGPWRPKNRTAVIDGTGQALYPAIRFEDGSWYREESNQMARTISAGRLMENQKGASP
jgi:hypothetical protein